MKNPFVNQTKKTGATAMAATSATKLTSAPAKSMIGRDSKTGSDMDFYDWISGPDTENTLGRFIVALLEEIKSESDSEELRQIILELKQNNTPETYQSWLQAFKQFFPADHQIHQIIQNIDG